MLPSISNLLKNSKNEISGFRREERFHQPKQYYPNDILNIGNESLPELMARDLFSIDPNDIISGLKKFSALYIGMIFTPPPSEEVILRLLELAGTSSFPMVVKDNFLINNNLEEMEKFLREIHFSASHDLSIAFLTFPFLRKLLLDNQFYLLPFNDLDRDYLFCFSNIIKIEPRILNELENNGIVEKVINHMINPISICIVSDIKAYNLFLKYEVTTAISNLNACIPFLIQKIFNFQNDLYNNDTPNDDVLRESLLCLATAVKFDQQILLQSDLFPFLIQNCLEFSCLQRIFSLKLLRNASRTCIFYFIDYNILSFIHAIFSSDPDETTIRVYALNICESFVSECTKRTDGQKMIEKFISPDFQLSKDLNYFSSYGSIDEKNAFIKIVIQLVKLSNLLSVSNFLADISCIQNIVDFLESEPNKLFPKVLESLKCLYDYNKTGNLSKSLSNQLDSQDSKFSLIAILEGFVLSNDELIQSFSEISQTLLTDLEKE